MSNEVQSWLDLVGQVHGLAMTVNVHEEDLRLSPEKVIVNSRDFQPVLKEGRHNGIHFFLQEHEISHHYVIPTVTLRQSKPSTEAERRRHGVFRDGDMQIVARDVDLEHVRFVVARPADKFENLLV